MDLNNKHNLVPHPVVKLVILPGYGKWPIDCLF